MSVNSTHSFSIKKTAFSRTENAVFLTGKTNKLQLTAYRLAVVLYHLALGLVEV